MLAPPYALNATISRTTSIVPGDIDNDRDVDLIIGNRDAPNEIYKNNGQGIFTASVFDTISINTESIALGDVNKDGFLDIAVGNDTQQNYLYINNGFDQFLTPYAFGTGSDETYGLVMGDMNADGTLDLVVGNLGSPNAIYLNDGTGTFSLTDVRYFGSIVDATFDLAVADINGNGHIDIITIDLSNTSISKLYLNDGVGNFLTDSNWPVGTNTSSFETVSAADLNNDGLVDVIAGGYEKINQVFLSYSREDKLLSNNPPYLTVSSPSHTGETNFYASPLILNSQTISISYTLYDPENDPIRYIKAYYSTDGGGKWHPATPSGNTITSKLTATITGTTHIFYWDVFQDGIFGLLNNVAFRIEAYPDLGYERTGLSDSYQRPYASATTFPFRVQGTQVRVLSGTVPISNALVYRLPGEQLSGGQPLADGGGKPFLTDVQGYLRGRSQIFPGDRLLALVPITRTESYTVYYTSGVPTEVGVDTFSVEEPGVQVLTVTSDHPLILFDLEVALEWDASADPVYLEQLAFDLKRSSQHLYDFTNGQVALGNVTVHQNADYWIYAHIAVQATNSLRPFAVQGGILTTTLTDTQHADIVYTPGQVRMGATWNRYGEAGEELGDDWALALGHELAHYLLYLDDTYLGLNNDGLLIPVDSCSGSAMGDVYTPDNTELIFNNLDWLASGADRNCEDTLAHQTLARNEWETLRLWYPWLVTPPQILTGPALMPFELTTVTILEPFTPTNVLDDPTFFINYADGAVSSSEAQAFLLRDLDNDGQMDFVIDLGKPNTGQNRVLARGVQQGDRLCVFDRAAGRQQFGCEVIDLGDQQLSLEKDIAWTPLIHLTPVNTQTFGLTVSGLSTTTLSLRARLYPEYGFGSEVIDLTPNGGTFIPPGSGSFFPPVDDGYVGTFVFTYPVLAGHVQVWVDETDIETNPRRETIIPFVVGGKPGKGPFWRGGGPFWRGGGPFWRGGGGTVKGGGPFWRGGGPFGRGGGAPLVSADGQMIFFTENPIAFSDDELYIIQSAANLPPLPAGKTAIGQGYNLTISPNITQAVNGSISFQYLGLDTLVEQVDENSLTIHFWDGLNWTALETIRSPYYNLASAVSQGAGLYALLAGQTMPTIVDFFPNVIINDLTTTLTITGTNFLPPMEVHLAGIQTHTLPGQLLDSQTVAIDVPAGLAAQAYQVTVRNGDGGSATAPDQLSVFNTEDACFYDFFESGVNKWARDGKWDIVRLQTGEWAMTDSPLTSYSSPVPLPMTYTTTITSHPFNLNYCDNPTLQFRHDYVIANYPSYHFGQVEIFYEGTWHELARYSGGGLFDTEDEQRDIDDSTEWVDVEWDNVNINLNEYSGAVQLRFSLVIDQHVAAKGWVIDEIKVISGSPPLTSTHTDLQISITGPSNHQAFDGQKLFYTLTATNTEAVAVDALVIYTWPQTFGTLAGCFPACTGSGPLTWSISGFTSTQVMTVALQTYPTSALSFQTQATITHTILNITDTNPTNNYAEHQIDILQPMSPTMSIYLPILAK